MSSENSENIELRIIGYRAAEAPCDWLVQGVVTSDEHGDLLGRVMTVTMSGLAKNGNRVLLDLYKGVGMFDVPQTFTGAYVDFSGCRMIGEDEFSATGYDVLDDGAEAEFDPGTSPQLLPGFFSSLPERAVSPAPGM